MTDGEPTPVLGTESDDSDSAVNMDEVEPALLCRARVLNFGVMGGFMTTGGEKSGMEGSTAAGSHREGVYILMDQTKLYCGRDTSAVARHRLRMCTKQAHVAQ